MDTRTKREKLLAMAEQSAASPREAAIARAKLATRVGAAHRTLSRAAILAAPDLRAHVPVVRVYDRSLRVWVVMDADDPAYASDGVV